MHSASLPRPVLIITGLVSGHACQWRKTWGYRVVPVTSSGYYYIITLVQCIYISDVRYIDFISISRYFCSYRIVSKSILHLLMLNKYRTAEFSDNISNYQA